MRHELQELRAMDSELLLRSASADAAAKVPEDASRASHPAEPGPALVGGRDAASGPLAALLPSLLDFFDSWMTPTPCRRYHRKNYFTVYSALGVSSLAVSSVTGGVMRLHSADGVSTLH